MKVVIIWLLMVLALSVVPLKDMLRNSPENADKIVHFFIYAVTGVLFYTEFLRSKSPALRRRGLWVALFCASGYGLLMEFVQGIMTTTRSFSLVDAEVNVLGAAVGLFVFKYVMRFPRARTRQN
jgi:VanZ family protein